MRIPTIPLWNRLVQIRQVSPQIRLADFLAERFSHQGDDEQSTLKHTSFAPKIIHNCNQTFLMTC